MKTTRDILFADRVFTIPDLMRLASVIDGQATDAPNERVKIEYEVVFDDGHTISGLASEVFAEEELNRPSRPIRIEMWFARMPQEEYIKIRLRSGDPQSLIENSVTISGNDPNWVNANYTTLQDALGKVAPQSLWWKRHQTLLLNLIALGGGTLEYAMLWALALASVRVWPELPSRVTGAIWPSGEHMWGLVVDLCYGWPWRWVLGIAYAVLVRRWLLKMWPSIEFDFGSRYLRPNYRREKLYTATTLFVLPIVVAAVYDLLKIPYK